MSEDIVEHKQPRFAYLRDPEDSRKVLTLGWYGRFEVSDQYKIVYDFAINKVVEKEVIKLDERVRQFIGNTIFKDVQKKLMKRYGGDQHCRKQARNVVVGKLARYGHTVYIKTDFDKKPSTQLIIFNIVESIVNRVDISEDKYAGVQNIYIGLTEQLGYNDGF